MPGKPGWVRRNRFVAWTAYYCVLIGFATLAMTLTAAGTGHHGWALTAGVVCAIAFLSGIGMVGTTARQDRSADHATPNLLTDSCHSLELQPAAHPAGSRLHLPLRHRH